MYLVYLGAVRQCAQSHKLKELLCKGDTDDSDAKKTADKGIAYGHTCAAHGKPDNVAGGMSLVIGSNILTERQESKLGDAEICDSERNEYYTDTADHAAKEKH